MASHRTLRSHQRAGLVASPADEGSDQAFDEEVSSNEEVSPDEECSSDDDSQDVYHYTIGGYSLTAHVVKTAFFTTGSQQAPLMQYGPLPNEDLEMEAKAEAIYDARERYARAQRTMVRSWSFQPVAISRETTINDMSCNQLMHFDDVDGIKDWSERPDPASSAAIRTRGQTVRPVAATKTDFARLHEVRRRLAGASSGQVLNNTQKRACVYMLYCLFHMSWSQDLEQDFKDHIKDEPKTIPNCIYRLIQLLETSLNAGTRLTKLENLRKAFEVNHPIPHLSNAIPADERCATTTTLWEVTDASEAFLTLHLDDSSDQMKAHAKGLLWRLMKLFLLDFTDPVSEDEVEATLEWRYEQEACTIRHFNIIWQAASLSQYLQMPDLQTSTFWDPDGNPNILDQFLQSAELPVCISTWEQKRFADAFDSESESERSTSPADTRPVGSRAEKPEERTRGDKNEERLSCEAFDGTDDDESYQESSEDEETGQSNNEDPVLVIQKE